MIDIKADLELHEKWLKGDPDGKRIDWDGEDLRDADLNGANLEGAKLSRTILSRADLKGANLHCAELVCANLWGTNLEGANLCRANLHHAILGRAKLKNANLTGACIACAMLIVADLEHADLEHADLWGANLSYANLSYANLTRAGLGCIDFHHANMFHTISAPSIPMNIPEGEFIAYKKVKDYIVKLKILADSKRSCGTSDKCRCDKALVLEIQTLDGNVADIESIDNNAFDRPIEYKVGEVVHADSWDDDRFDECSHGIHFFMSRRRAVEY